MMIMDVKCPKIRPVLIFLSPNKRDVNELDDDFKIFWFAMMLYSLFRLSHIVTDWLAEIKNIEIAIIK